VTVRRRLGERQPTHATAQGKVLLAYLPGEEQAALLKTMRLTAYSPRTITRRAALEVELRRTAQRGYAVNNNEMDAGLRAVAVPVCEPPGKVAAALSLDVPVGRLSLAQIQAELLDPLRAAAEEISSALGYQANDTE
jgi:DNA-binding IclR family transcriptional regulator